MKNDLLLLVSSKIVEEESLDFVSIMGLIDKRLDIN